MKTATYPAIFRVDEEEPKYINVSIPDIWGAVTFGEGMEDAIYMAKDLLKLMLEDAPAQCYPPHSLEHTQEAFPGETVLMITVEYDETKNNA